MQIPASMQILISYVMALKNYSQRLFLNILLIVSSNLNLSNILVFFFFGNNDLISFKEKKKHWEFYFPLHSIFLFKASIIISTDIIFPN